jgi:hypothetical protein
MTHHVSSRFLNHLRTGGGLAIVWFFLEFAWHFYRKVGKENRILTWPIRYGMVVEAVVYRGTRSSCLTITYHYSPPDESEGMTGSAEFDIDSFEQAECWAQALENKTVPVRVDPKNPGNQN